MNKENIQQLIDVLKSEEGLKGVTFDMSRYYGEDEVCGTVACIAGHAALLADRLFGFTPHRAGAAYYIAKSWLDISQDQADRLFYALNFPGSIYDVTKAQAVAALEHLRDTGEVDWQAAVRKAEEA